MVLRRIILLIAFLIHISANFTHPHHKLHHHQLNSTNQLGVQRIPIELKTQSFPCNLESFEHCFAIHLQFQQGFHFNDLEFKFQPEETNNSVRKIIFDFFHEHRQSILGPMIDSLLLARPWWIITKEDYLENSAHIQLIRYPSRLEPHLKFIAGLQFPPSEEACSKTPIHYAHETNSGWGSQLLLYSGFIEGHRWRIFSPWSSDTGKTSESVMFANSDQCPTIVNKWECAFLLPTNCTTPSFFSTCFDDNQCFVQTNDPVFDQATSIGRLVSNEEKNELGRDVTVGVSPPHLLALKPLFIQAQSVHLTPSVEYRHANRGLCPKGSRMPSTLETLRVFGQLFRPNHSYRSMISQRIREFSNEGMHRGLPPWLGTRELPIHAVSSTSTLTQSPSPPSGNNDSSPITPTPPIAPHLNSSLAHQCTAIHIRRGDRVVGEEDMNKYCQQFRMYSPSNCTNIVTGAQVYCDYYFELGCFGVHPFGGLKLKDYLERAWELQKTKTVFVMTDDNEWLAKEAAELSQGTGEYSDWQVYWVGSHGKEDRSTSTPKATRNGVDFLSSVHVSQQCGAFVGHWGSAVSQLIYRAMCFYHQRSMGQCPKTYDIGSRVDC